MRLFEAIVAANHLAVTGQPAALQLSDHADSLPIAALTCIDPRLNKLLPGALGIDEERFIWLRNAGNVITSSTSSTVRSISISIFLKGAREVAVLGHTDCRMSKLTMADLLTRLQEHGIRRTDLDSPNLHEFFGLFSSETQNVIKAANYLRHSPFIPPKIPVHGLVIDTHSGRLNWIVNGYDTLSQALPIGSSVKDFISTHMPATIPNSVTEAIADVAGKFEPIAARKWEAVAEHIEKSIKGESPTIADPKKPVPPPLLRKKRQDAGPYR